MIEYIIALFFFLWIYRGYRFFIIKRKDFSKTKVIEGAEPFFHNRGKVGVLFIHGFSSSCYDYIELDRYLGKRGITTKAVLLDGHGTSPEHLLTTNDDDWKRSVVKGMSDLRKHVDKAFICGDSMGGALAIWYAGRDRVDGVISIGTPVFIKREKLFKFIFPVLRMFKLYQKKWYHTFNLDPEIIQKRVTYRVIPLKSVVFAAKVIKEAKKSIRKVRSPILIMQSTSDWGVGEGSVDYIYRNAGSLVKQVVWIKDAYHVVIVDRKKEEAFRHIYRFIDASSREEKK
jgi:carboxylesterase